MLSAGLSTIRQQKACESSEIDSKKRSQAKCMDFEPTTTFEFMKQEIERGRGGRKEGK